MEAEDGGLVVMVVDDYDDTRWVVRHWLEKKGYRVVEAVDGEDAVEKASRDTPDLILMDIEMPRLDGLGAARRLRAQGGTCGVPIIAVSAYGADEFRQRALDAGCDEYVTTPFAPAELEAMIARMLPRPCAKGPAA